jgi:CO/xanthine dehydrogenase FAD-binding subunit
MIERSYFEPSDLSQARSILAEHASARILAGGTDLVVAARSGKSPLPHHLIAIGRLKELIGLDSSPDRGLKIGALTTHGDLEISGVVRRSWTALSDASALVGSPATRHLGTVGGNVCNASPAMELGSPLLVFDARVELVNASGSRHLSFGSFVVGPGRTLAEPNELLTSVVLPPPPPGQIGSAYVRLEYRMAMEIAVVGAAAMICLDASGRCSHVRVALTAVGPTCVRATASEELLEGRSLDPGLIKVAAEAASGASKPIDDVRASAAYRRAMVPVMVGRALTKALQRAASASAA